MVVRGESEAEAAGQKLFDADVLIIIIYYLLTLRKALVAPAGIEPA
jgi:hypothetical protein